MTKEFNEPETLVNRLQGIYEVGPTDKPKEFKREFPERPAINHEAARRIEQLQAEVEHLKREEYLNSVRVGESLRIIDKLRADNKGANKCKKK